MASADDNERIIQRADDLTAVWYAIGWIWIALGVILDGVGIYSAGQNDTRQFDSGVIVLSILIVSATAAMLAIGSWTISTAMGLRRITAERE